MLKKISGNVLKDFEECSRRFGGMLKKIPGNVRKDSGESKFRFILWSLAYFLSNSAIKLRQNNGIFSTLLLATYNESPALKYCFSSTFFLSLCFLLLRKGCNYCARVEGYQKSSIKGFKKYATYSMNHQFETWKLNKCHRLHPSTLTKISFKNLTPGLYTPN